VISLRRKNKKRQATKKDKIFKSCKTFPLERYVAIQNSEPTDFRYLLDVDDIAAYPDGYFTDELMIAYDTILKEDQELAENRAYTNYLESANYLKNMEVRLARYNSIITIWEFGYKKEAIELIKEAKIKYTKKELLINERNKLYDTIKIRQERLKGKISKKLNDVDMIMELFVTTGRKLENPSVKEYRALEKIAIRMNQQSHKKE